MYQTRLCVPTVSWSLLKLMSIESMMDTPRHPLSPSSPAFNLSQHQDLFQWVSSSQQVAKVLAPQLQPHSFHQGVWLQWHVQKYWFSGDGETYCCSVAQARLTLCDPMDCSMTGFPVLHHLTEFSQTHVHWVGEAIQPSQPPLSSSLAFNLFQHQGLFWWIGSSHQVAKVLELQLQHQSFQGIFRIDFLYDWLVWCPCSPRDSQESSPTPYFKGINSSALMHSKNVEIENLTVYKMKWGRCCCSLFNDGFDI